MEYAFICGVAFVASGLTLFSGFGLGTLLMPIVALFFSIELAIAMTAIVHLANNLFKIGLLGRKADIAVLLKFGIPAVVAALVGAELLAQLGELSPAYEYKAFGQDIQIAWLKLVIGLLILLFVGLELFPPFASIRFGRQWLALGGMISGFFGGLSGHQGALRSMFLLKANLDQAGFVATGVVLAVMVDVSRLMIYGLDISSQVDAVDWPLVIAACFAAFAGAYFGSKALKKVTIRSVQILVSILLTLVAAGLITGVL